MKKAKRKAQRANRQMTTRESEAIEASQPLVIEDPEERKAAIAKQKELAAEREAEFKKRYPGWPYHFHRDMLMCNQTPIYHIGEIEAMQAKMKKGVIVR